MESEGKCILLKVREYNELVKKAESTKPNYIQFRHYTYTGKIYHELESDIKLSEPLRRQVYNIFNNAIERINNAHDEIFNDGKEHGKEELIKSLKNMSWLERRSFLKQY